MNYPNFRYLFPPRPEVKIPPSSIKDYEEKNYVAQPKLNGSCAVLFTDGHQVILMNRHAKTFGNKLLIDNKCLKSLHRGNGWLVLTGEYMNKSKRDTQGKLFNGCFVIFDVLVYQSQHLELTFEERQKLLDELYEGNPYDGYISKIENQLYRVNNFKTNLTQSFGEITKTDMYEGFVLKRPSAPLEIGWRSANNVGWQLKIRKPTKNYAY